MFTIYKDAYQTSGKDIEPRQVAALIKSQRLKDVITKLNLLPKSEQAKFKNTLPCFTFYGTFGRKTANDIKQPYGVMILDYDEDKSVENINKLKSILLEKYHHHILMMFNSPRGGLKIAFKTNLLTTDSKYYEFAYKRLVRSVTKSTGFAFDNTCNINRLCMASSDSNLVFNALAVDYDIECFIDYLAYSKKIVEERKSQERFFNNQEIDLNKKTIYGQKAIKKFMDSYNQHGDRHRGTYILGMRLFSLGFDVNEVTREFNHLKSIGAFTDPDPRSRAMNISTSWKDKGSISPYVIKKNKNTLSSFVSAFSI